MDSLCRIKFALENDMVSNLVWALFNRINFFIEVASNLVCNLFMLCNLVCALFSRIYLFLEIVISLELVFVLFLYIFVYMVFIIIEFWVISLAEVYLLFYKLPLMVHPISFYDIYTCFTKSHPYQKLFGQIAIAFSSKNLIHL